MRLASGRKVKKIIKIVENCINSNYNIGTEYN